MQIFFVLLLITSERLEKLDMLSVDKKERLSKHLKEAESDIKAGANACQVYKKKATFVRFIKSPIWEKRFTDLMKRYNDHRKKFSFLLIVDTAHSIDSVSKKLDDMNDKQDRLLHK